MGAIPKVRPPEFWGSRHQATTSSTVSCQPVPAGPTHEELPHPAGRIPQLTNPRGLHGPPTRCWRQNQVDEAWSFDGGSSTGSPTLRHRVSFEPPAFHPGILPFDCGRNWTPNPTKARKVVGF